MRLGPAVVVVALTLELTIPEFAELQPLGGHDLRQRLKLPDSCEPSLAAVRTSSRGSITVLVSCTEAEESSEAGEEAAPGGAGRGRG